MAGPCTPLVNNVGVSPKAPAKERLGCRNGDIVSWHGVYHRFPRSLAVAQEPRLGDMLDVVAQAQLERAETAGRCRNVPLEELAH